jgi:hypothetical protein
MFKKTMGVVLGLALAPMARAATSVFEMPQVFPKHVQLQQQLVQTVRAGRTEEMERVCREGVALMPEDATWRYNLACALAWRADKTEALAELDKAIDFGFRDADAIRKDTDLKNLAKEPRFEELVKKAEALRGKPVEGAARVGASRVFRGVPAEINGSNTVWDFDAGCFKTYFALQDAMATANAAASYCGPAAEAVRGWLGEKSAAGNFGDLYLNRDGGHSALAATNFPFLTPVVYGDDARRHKVDTGVPNALFEPAFPVIGNSSMSMTQGPFWRSLPRAITTDPFQPIMAFRLYLGNQCWFYPEHRDYDPETGDLFPANTPYYVVSQGSSFSDKPFMEAFAAALAALRPEVKRDLVARKWLAPTLQMLFRASQKTVKTPEDYLTGAAHPVVFDAVNLDAGAMVKRAHDLTPGGIPPPVALRTVKDAQPEMGVDYFDVRTEGLFDTPFAIARVVRGVALKRSMTLEAVAPLKPGEAVYRWVVLQGDPAKIEIKPLTPSASQVEVTVAYHGLYRPKGADGLPAPIQSSRVDIGCFVKVGDLWSAPSFVSFYCLPSEARVYRDDGRILSVDYSNAAHHYADPALTIQKGWKDLYDYDGQGRLLGWYRTRAGGQPERFTWRGHKVLATDAKNRPTQACAVEYLPRQTGVAGMPPTLSCADTQKRFAYTYADDQDQMGKAAPVK